MSALICVDLQNEFLSGTGNFPIPEPIKEPLLRNLPPLVSHFRRRGEVVWIRSIYSAPSSVNEQKPRVIPDPDAFLLSGTHTGGTPCCTDGSLGSEFPPEIQSLINDGKDAVIMKRNYSAFNDSENALLTHLQTSNIKSLFICGLLSNMCVLATAIAAQKLGCFDRIVIVGDCLAYRREKSHLGALKRYRELRIPVVDSLDIIAGDDSKLVPPPPLPKLYYVNGSIPSWRVQMALHEKNIEVEQIRMRVMLVPKPTRQPDFLAINPRGKTPVLIDVDPEGTKTQPRTKSLLPPISERKRRARILSLIQESENIHWIYDDLEDAHFTAKNTRKPLRPNERQELIAKVYEELQFWETYASNSGSFIGGSEFTLADCAFYPILAYMVHRGLDLKDDRWRGLRAYHEKVSAMECAKWAQPEGWEEPGRENMFTGIRRK